MTDVELLVDGMLSGTGIRDVLAGGYLKPDKLGLSASLKDRLAHWLSEYEEAHFFDFKDELKVQELDTEGIEIAREMHIELPKMKVGYFSSAKMRRLELEG